MSTLGDTKDLIVIAGVGVAGVLAYNYIKKNNFSLKNFFAPSLEKTYTSLENRSNAITNDMNGVSLREGDTLFHITQEELKNASPYERTLLNRGASVAEVQRISAQRSAIANVLRTALTTNTAAITKLVFNKIKGAL